MISPRMPKKAKNSTYTIHVEALRKISEAITSDSYLEDVLRLIVTVTAQVMNSKICSLMLLDHEKKELVIKATQSISDAYNRKPNIKIGQGIAGKVVQRVTPIQVLDVRKNNQYINQAIAKKEGLCSLLSVPLTFKSKIIGVLNCYTSSPHKFTREEINVITTVANQSAIVIENSRLLVESHIIREELETKKQVEKAKRILMKTTGLTEEDAFRKIQKCSMDSRKSIRDVAESIITTSHLL